MSVYGEYTDFKFGNTWASEFGLVAVSSGGRYKTPIYGDVNANLSTVPGRRGAYKWESQIGTKTFSINIAFDHLAIEDIDKIKKWLDPEQVDKLYFDNEPYKYYYASLSQDLDFSYVPFKEEEYTVGDNTFTHAVYKGEMTITFVAIDGYGYSDWDNYEQYDFSHIISTNDSTLTFESDNIITSADEVFNNLQYYTMASGVEITTNNGKAEYRIQSGDSDPVYLFSTDKKLSKDLLQSMIDTLQENDIHLYHATANQQYELASESLGTEDDPSVVTTADGCTYYTYNSSNIKIRKILEEATTGSLKPWVVGSGLLNSSTIYKNNNIYTSSVDYGNYDDDDNILYLLNSGTAEAVPIITFDVEEDNIFNAINIYAAPARLSNGTWAYEEDKIQELNLNLNKMDSTMKNYVNTYKEDHTDGFSIEINCEICEAYLQGKSSSTKINITKLIGDNFFIILNPCENVDYSKAFPTSSLGEKSAISKTTFNAFRISTPVNNLKIKWRHTYL